MPIDPWFVLVGLGVILLLMALFVFLSRGGTRTPPKDRSHRRRGHGASHGAAGSDGPARH